MKRNLHTELQKLRDEAVKLLRNRPEDLSLRQIAEETGLSRDWLVHMLRPNASKNPRADFVQALYDYLKHVRRKAA